MIVERPKALRVGRRRFLTGAACVGGLAMIAAPALAEETYDAVVGEGGFASLSDALAAAPDASQSPFKILIEPGSWYEKLTIDKPNIHLIGRDRERTVLVFDAAAGLTAPDGSRWGTFRSATLTIRAPGCALRNLTLKNAFDYVGARENPEENPAGDGLQAVALSVLGEADRTFIENVNMESWQDTLLVDAGRTHLRNCRISGAVDYIFGKGAAYFEACEIETLGRAGAQGGRLGYVAAPSTLLQSPFGLVFEGCRLTKTPGLAAGTIALARPWRPTTTFDDGRYGNPDAVGQAVFLRCWMDDHIDPDGWDRMGFNAKGGGRGWTLPQDARFYEFQSEGPGGQVSEARRQLSTLQAGAYARTYVLGGWEPAT